VDQAVVAMVTVAVVVCQLFQAKVTLVELVVLSGDQEAEAVVLELVEFLALTQEVLEVLALLHPFLELLLTMLAVVVGMALI
jgi:hypothetical protein